MTSSKCIKLVWLALLFISTDYVFAAEFVCPIQFSSEENPAIKIIRSMLGSETALEGYDSKDVITAPPGMGLSIYFETDVFPFYLASDARYWFEPYRTAIRWRVIVKNNIVPLQLDWDVEQLPRIMGGRFVLSGVNEGSVEMLFTGSATLPAVDAEINIDYIPSTSLAVEMRSLSASCIDGAVVVSWQTESESDHLGFDVYRSGDSQSEYQKINERLIVGCGHPLSGRLYQFRDETVAAGGRYYYRIADVDRNGKITLHGPVFCSVSWAANFILEQNYPNPFSASTMIELFLPTQQKVTLTVYNLLGQQVAMITDRILSPGFHHFNFSILPAGHLPSGIYVCKAVAGKEIRKIYLSFIGKP